MRISFPTLSIVFLIFSASEDCEECGNYVRHVFSIVPGSLALIILFIVLFFHSSKPTCEGNGKMYLYTKSPACLQKKQLTGLYVCISEQIESGF